MDKISRKTVFMFVSYFLGYPSEEMFWSVLDEALVCVEELPESSAKQALRQAGRMFSQANHSELEKMYCEEFDFREATSLYLTAHELGDSRKRGMAMGELRRMFAKGGFLESNADDLPDYLPRLFEFISVKPDDLDTTDLEMRLAPVCHEIVERLNGSAPYRYVLYAALCVLPSENGVSNEDRFPMFEQADLDELPYPLYYQ